MAENKYLDSDLNHHLSLQVEDIIRYYNEGDLLEYLDDYMRDVEFIFDIHANYRGGRFILPYTSSIDFLVDEKGYITIVDKQNGYHLISKLLPDDVFEEICVYLEDKSPFSSTSLPAMSSPGRSMRSASRLSSRSGMARPTSSLRSATRSSDLRRK